MLIVILITIGIIGLWIFGFCVGRNNPNLKSVNNLIAKGKVFIDTTGKIIKSVKKVA